MPKKRAVILRLKTWQIIKRMIRDYLAGRLTNRPVVKERRRWPRGGKSKCDVIRFEITAVEVPEDASPVRALCGIKAVPDGFGHDDVPDRVLTNPIDGSGGLVYIYDPHECFFTEPQGSLLGRLGWARYMNPLDDVSGYAEPRFEVFSLCCDEPGCS